MSARTTTILVVNVNTTAAVTDQIVAVAREAAGPGTEVVGLTPRVGAESVEGWFESHLSAVAVIDAVLAHEAPFDAVVQAGFGEHGVEALRELLDVPVVDITEAAAMTACLVGRSFSVVTTLDRAVGLIEDRLRLTGIADRCASVRATDIPVLELERDPARAVERIVEESVAAVRDDRAEVICLGCAGMAGLEEAVRAAARVPVVDGVRAAVRLAESLVALGLSTSKSRSYAPPRAKAFRGWPLA
ncbi:aspartate/glutamate racemase family protein [Nocardioides sp. AN3]